LGQIYCQSAGSSAARERPCLRARQSRAAAVHLLAALLEDKEGIVPPVLEKIGIGPQAVLAIFIATSKSCPKFPVAENRPRPHFEANANKLLEQAFKEAANFKDEYVSTEHLLLAITHLKRMPAQQILARHGATYDAILKALTGGPRIAESYRPESRSQVSGAGKIRSRSDRASPPRQARSRHRSRRRRFAA
jgi:ATP-dependent Clp protease ATP-binding subunit ClpA